MSRGFFITFEGLDGSGKSTQLRKLAQWLEPQGHRVTVTRQPGGTHVGDRIRALLLDSKTENVAPETELGRCSPYRAQSIAEVIRPALQRGKSSCATAIRIRPKPTRAAGASWGSEVVLKLHAAMCGDLWPDLTILLLPDFERSLERARRRNSRGKGPDENRFERENERFYRRVFDKYREIAAREHGRVVMIEGDAGIEDVHERVVGGRAGQAPC